MSRNLKTIALGITSASSTYATLEAADVKRRQIEKSLDKYEKNFSELVNLLPQTVYESDSEGKFVLPIGSDLKLSDIIRMISIAGSILNSSLSRKTANGSNTYLKNI
jgi:hypothetical protein